MSNQPWLDNLDDDWVSVPGTPSSPVPTRSANHSRRTSLQSLQGLPSSPSRIPKKKVSRPCHFVRREPPTPKTPRTPKTHSKLRSPAPDKTKKTPKPDLPSARKQKPAMDTRSPLRSVSNASTQSGQQGTVQVRPKKGKTKEGTPEWRRKLVRGELPSGEQRDLFAPMGLEGKTQHEAIPKMKQRDDLWDFGNPSDKDSGTSPQGHAAYALNDEDRPLGPSTQLQSNANPSDSPEGSPNATLEMPKDPEEPPSSLNDRSFITQDDTQMRSATGLEDLRNEVEGNGTSEVIRSALKQVTSKLQKLSLPPYERPDSRASDSILFNQHTEFTIDPPPEEDIFDVTSHSLPQDLSMGTLDYRGRGPFGNLRREQYTNESSFHKHQLSPPTFTSQRLSPFFAANSRIRSSPPFYNRTNPILDPPTLPRPSSAHVKAPILGEDKSEVMPSSGSPLKLFGNHDTFTNNRLLRRMSQFEETFDNLSEEDEPASPSEEARRKGESRSFLSARHNMMGENSIRRVERPRSRNTANSRLSRFGDGQLDNFDFADTSPYEPKLLSSDAPDGELRPLSRRRRYLRRPSHRESSRRSEVNSHNSTSKTSTIDRGFNASKNQDSIALTNPDQGEAEWNPGSPAKDPNPKRRRTFLRSHIIAGEDQEEVVSSSQPIDNLSLLQRSLMQHGLRYDSDSLLRPQSSDRPRTPTPSQTRGSIRKRSSPSKSEPDVVYNDENSPSETNVPMVKVTGIHEETRKGSITTQDFLNEATKIMDIIRSKGRNVGGLSSVEESEAEDKNESESYEDESTREEFSRPPSREGVDMRKLREQQETNPRIISHLKKFQEHDDLELGDNASVASLSFDNQQDSPFQVENDKEFVGQDDGAAINQTSDNMQPEDDIFEQRERKSSAPTSGEDDDLPDLLTFNTQISAKSLSARSVPTGSSQSSHAKGVLSSDIVSHLIPEQVNGLTYDRHKHQWIKERPEVSLEKPKGEDSEDDPFKDIPDLSVDELQEMMRMQNSPSPERIGDSVLSEDANGQSPLSRKTGSPSSVARPGTKACEPSVAASSLQSKASRSTSSTPHSATRVTSWGSEAPGNRASSSEVEHEIQLHEAEPFEPYWEHVRRLVLRQKGLITLHKLCDFCPRLEDLDVSSNSIGQLSGVPPTLRTLRISHNCLSNLTAWGHLVNLQYLDVSGNELESLDGFSSLIHLRELKAEDNNIRNIEGIFELDGLLSLKLRNNSLTNVDFEDSELVRLEELDLSHNQLMSIQNIESLSALSSLDLSFNQLARVAPSAPMPYLSSLRLSSNQLHSLDVTAFPSLTLLYLDHNYLFTVSGLEHCAGLDVFSAREQMNTSDHNGGFFDVDLGLVKDVRKVFLSCNKLSLQCLSPSNPLSGLQLLDVASCSIQSLPADFALSFPNIRVLNLNFNSLSGINELAGLNCLSRLTIASNCIVRLRRLCQVLSRIGRTNKNKVSTLQKVDVRGNPLTVRFYPPAVTGSGRVGDAKDLKVEDEPSQREQAGLDIQSVLAEFGHAENSERSIVHDQDDEPVTEKDIEINDPYTLPPADPQADQKYLSHLDEPTRLRRRVFELMLYAGTGGSLKFLDGLQLRPTLEPGSDMDHAWNKLEKLGVLKRKAITG
ncbi:hypothetical protein BDV24DRAFT_178110 [Aspergillus arachidicola]|uniref:Uncharacterized protein n=1 Tax=Aspergillus arachidicola TaxID=656916 RepID=A0A5N6XUH9_9EURO|nr:hypothetical protein BDV24DRAFT_178110 [Aspergillus arachidicola]